MSAADAAQGVVIRGVDHVGLTVPDIDAAERFLIAAFDAQFLFDVHGLAAPRIDLPPSDKPIASPKGARVRAIRMYKLGTGPGIELFQFEANDQQRPAFTSDLGWQHVAFYVDDLEGALERARKAGGEVLDEPWDLRNDESGPGGRVAFVRAPFGGIIELITYPNPLRYEAKTRLRRWKPPRAATSADSSQR
jgi:catechol 2,3-dioxygenase-like lactoylglutathione lyase family enzyme